jgi:hypothetical protein
VDWYSSGEGQTFFLSRPVNARFRFAGGPIDVGRDESGNRLAVLERGRGPRDQADVALLLAVAEALTYRLTSPRAVRKASNAASIVGNGPSGTLVAALTGSEGKFDQRPNR